jgi:hypothetical protein
MDTAERFGRLSDADVLGPRILACHHMVSCTWSCTHSLHVQPVQCLLCLSLCVHLCMSLHPDEYSGLPWHAGKGPPFEVRMQD